MIKSTYFKTNKPSSVKNNIGELLGTLVAVGIGSIAAKGATNFLKNRVIAAPKTDTDFDFAKVVPPAFAIGGTAGYGFMAHPVAKAFFLGFAVNGITETVNDFVPQVNELTAFATTDDKYALYRRKTIAGLSAISEAEKIDWEALAAQAEAENLNGATEADYYSDEDLTDL